jgi:hypothetical protein
MINSDPTLMQRIKRLMPVKAVGTTLFIYIFFRAYFWVMENPNATPFTVPTTLIDDWVPFNIIGLPIYLSLWIYVSLPPALLNSIRALLIYGFWVTLMCVACLLIFWFFPTATPPALIDISRYPSMAFLRVDTGLNAFPSLHVASAVFTSAWLGILIRKLNASGYIHVINIIYCLLIIWSTMAVRQHVFWDAIAGTIVGLLFAILSIRHMLRQLPQNDI